MVSDTAIEEINRLKAKGLDPTPQDIIRLNALALKASASNKKNASTSLDYLPRIAAISRNVCFRQPTIGHEIFFAKADQISSDNLDSVLAVRAYALSRPPSDLVDPFDRDAFKKAVDDFLLTISDFTRDQIFAAIDYVIYGANHMNGEHPPHEESDDDHLLDDEDWKECVAAGVMNEARTVLWGVTAKELESMTTEQVWEMTRNAYMCHGLTLTKEPERRTAEFYRAIAEIEHRLTEEKKQEHGDGEQ